MGKLRFKKQSGSLIVLVILLTYVFAGNMLAVFSAALPYRDWIRLLLTAIGCSMLLDILFRNVVSSKNILLLQFLFILFTVFPTLYRYCTTTTVPYAILQTGDSLLWIGVFAWAYRLGLHENDLIDRASWIALSIPVYSLLFLGVKRFSAGQGIPLISTAYYALFLLPFAFLIKRKWIMWPLVFMAFSTVLLSAKRAGFISFVLCIAAFYYYTIKCDERGQKDCRRKTGLILGGAVLAISLYVFFESYTATHSINVLSRLNRMGADGGSGRIDIWVTTWNMIRTSEIVPLMFGHGFNAVYHDSVLKLSAHMDFLEVLYDYGIIGFVLYLGFWNRLLVCFGKVRTCRPDLAAPYAASMVLMVCMSSFAHLLIYPTHFLFLCLFWGLIFGELDQGTVVSRRKFYGTTH